MEDQLTDLIYQKYEQFSIQYIISTQQIDNFLKQINFSLSTIDEISKEIDEMINNQCYFNLLTTSVDNFEEKLKHNIEIAQKNADITFLKYLSRKFQITDDITTINPLTWTYKSHKIKLKLKSSIQNVSNQRYYTIKTLLADLLCISTKQKFFHLSDIMKLVHKYIYDNQLQNKINKNQIDVSNSFGNILLPLDEIDISYTYYNLQKYIKHLINCYDTS